MSEQLSTEIDGIYFLHPEGGAWVAAHFCDGELVDVAYEADFASHCAARDDWENIAPGDADVEVPRELADEIVRSVLGVDALPELVVVQRAAPWYHLELRDEGGSTHTVQLGTDRPDEFDIVEKCEEWAQGGDWGTEGASVPVWWELYADGKEIDSGAAAVEIEADHAALIRNAVGKWGEAADRCCGTDPDDHDWTSEGEGGLDENPGVWSVGGTKMVFRTHCRTCGLRRREVDVGSQHNPGEHDTVKYEMPDRWCEECQREDCDGEDCV